jgi:hypothetical protein
MMQTKTTGLLCLLAVGLLPIFASSEGPMDRRFFSLQTRVSRNKTADAPQPNNERLPGHLRWVRGSVIAWAADSLTLQLKKKSLTLDFGVSPQIVHAIKGTQKVVSVDQLKDEVTGQGNEAKPDSLAVGSLVQAHYFERHNKSYAVLIVEETEPAPKSAKDSGSSYLGVFEKIEFGALDLRINGRTRRLHPRSITFIDSTGARLPVRELKAGDRLVIPYRMYAEPVGGIGDISGISPSPQTAVLEIHRLAQH